MDKGLRRVSPWLRRLSSLALASLIGLIVGLVLLPGQALAEKLPTPLLFDTSGQGVCAITMYATTPDTQQDAFKAIFKTSKSFYKAIPGFEGFALLASTDGARVLELTQWQSQDSYTAFQTSLTTDAANYEKFYSKYKGEADPVENLPLLTAIFTIQEVAVPPGMVPVIPGEAALVSFSRYAPEDGSNPSGLMASAREALAALPELYPAPRNALLLEDPETAEVALLTTWGNVTEFADGSGVPGLTLLPPPGQGLEVLEGVDDASPTPGFSPDLTPVDDYLFQVVKVIAAKPENT